MLHEMPLSLLFVTSNAMISMFKCVFNHQLRNPRPSQARHAGVELVSDPRPSLRYDGGKEQES